MKIAVTSQNRRDVTEHAGRCRNFWVYEIDGLQVVDRRLLELPKEASFHDAERDSAHPLDGVDVLISGGMGEGLRQRLARRGIEALVTTETRPERAVQAWLTGDLPVVEPEPHGHTRHACSCQSTQGVHHG